MPPRAPVPPATTPGRLDSLDALRGAAMVWMMAFHLCFDLNLHRLLEPVQNFYRDPFWTWQRTAIVSLFLLCAGAGQALAAANAQDWPRFWRRWAQVAGCALLVSIGSWWMFPKSWISFGVLHGMAVMLPLLRLLWPLRARNAGLLWALAALSLALPALATHEVFNTRWLNWTGLVTRLPVTEDYVPVLPWIGVMLAGALALPGLMRRLPGTLPAIFKPLAWLGRWPLTVYMLHQPLFLGGILAWKALAAG